MFGNPGKLGRGGGGGGGRGGSKRMGHTLPPPHRSTGAAPRQPIGAASASRNRNGGLGSGPGAPPATEETFSLQSEEQLAFGMIVRVTPYLVEEMQRIEAQGGTARIKFGSHPNNSTGNVIDVGGKDFIFTWSGEFGECDIYQEYRSGEDGNGLLLESGSAWRKLNVQRDLDESTKNHVKMRTEEAERQSKSRKAIVLDPTNPSVKSQAKTMVPAAIESTRWHWKQKKEPALKKRKVEPSQGPPKSVFKPGTSSKATTKNRLSVSPLTSPHEQLKASASPLRIGNLSKVQGNVDEVIVPRLASKEDNSNPGKETPNRAVNASAREILGHKGSIGATPVDLRSTLISLLLENPKGMSLKALEKAVGDTHPNSGRKIEAIIKKIATYQAPGRYILNPGVEMESFKKPSSESGSSPECLGKQTPLAEPTFAEKTTAEDFEQQTQLGSGLEGELNVVEKIDAEKICKDIFGSEDKANNNSYGRAGNSSESGSDSESDSDSSDSGSDSGSQSRSRSKSRSPAGSGSGSSSDSDSDGSSSSKEGSDQDVDIMSDDDKEEVGHKFKVTSSKNCIDENKLDNHISSPAPDSVDIEKCDDTAEAVDIIDESPIANNINICENREKKVAESIGLVPHETKMRSLDEPFSPGHQRQSENQQFPHIGNFHNDTRDHVMKQNMGGRKKMVKDSSSPKHSDHSERVKAKSKRGFDLKVPCQEKLESAKRLKAASDAQDSYKYHTPPVIDRANREDVQDSFKYHTPTVTDRANRDGNTVSGRSMVYESVQRTQMGADLRNPSIPETHQPGLRTIDLNAKGKATDLMERPGKHTENFSRVAKHSERVFGFPDESDVPTSKNVNFQHKFQTKDRLQKETQDEDGDSFEKSFMRNARGSGAGDKSSMVSDSQFRKCGEQGGKIKDGAQMTHLNSQYMPDDNSKPDVDRGSMLRREVSDLELGEFREPVPEEAQAMKRSFERKNSFKSSENKPSSQDNLSYDLGRGGPVGRLSQESKKPSPSNLKSGAHGNQEALFKKRMSEADAEDSTRPQQRFVPPQALQFPRADRNDVEAGSQLDKLADMASKARKNVSRENQGSTLDSHRTTPSGIIQQHEAKRLDQLVNSNAGKETKAQKSNTVTESTDRRKDGFWKGNNANGRKGRESSSDEDNSFYSKYDKDEPELKGPIKDHMQYEEYVREYKTKYEHYCLLNMDIESYRSNFQKLNQNLELAKGRDGYYNILEQIKETYRRCGMKHKQMKKVFIVLHEELKHLKQRIKDYAQTYSKD